MKKKKVGRGEAIEFHVRSSKTLEFWKRTNLRDEMQRSLAGISLEFR